MDDASRVVHGVIEQDGNTVRIAEHERNTAVIRDERIRIRKGIGIVMCASPRISPKGAHDLCAMYLANRTDSLRIKAQRRKVPPPILPHIAWFVANMECHIERIERHRAYASLTRRKSMYEAILWKDIKRTTP